MKYLKIKPQSFLLVIFLFLFSQNRDALGDVNNDSIIDILDIVRVVHIILDDDTPPTEYELWAADVNADAEINVQDIIVIITVILDTIDECPEYQSPCSFNLTECCYDTTSHNFIWEIDTLGIPTGNINGLDDAFIFNENDIWLVGEIYTADNDSNGFNDHFNALHWDGTEWEFIAITVPPYHFVGRLYSIFGFAEDDIWTTAALPIYYDGNEWALPPINLDGFPNPIGTIYHCWGTSSNNMYFGIETGDIVHWDGTEFELMPTSTGSGDGTDCDVYVVDLWGIAENNIWALVQNWNQLDEDYPITVLHFNGYYWEDQYVITDLWPIPGEVSGTLYNVWAYGDTLYMISGWYGLWKESITTGIGYYDDMDEDNNPDHYARGTGLKGNHYNDIYTVSWQAKYTHYNGSTWYYGTEVHDYLEDMDIEYKCTGIDVKDNTIILYGYINIGGKVWVARGTRIE